jgi:polygalacturonase
MRTLLCICLLAFSAHAQRVFNVKDFGAKGDDKTDDAPAIQRAIDHTAGAGGGQVYFPAGTFQNPPILHTPLNASIPAM